MSFWERMNNVINQGIEVSKDVLIKAKEKAKDLGEIGILKYDIMKLEKQAEKNFLMLGSKVVELFIEKNMNSIKRDTPEIKSLIDDILDAQKKIEEKEELLKKV